MPIVPVEISDKDCLFEIVATAIQQGVTASADAHREFIAHSQQNIARYLDSSDCVFLKYVDNEKIQGYILIKDYWNLSDLFVRPEFQRRGIGKALLNQAKILCRENGEFEYIRLNSSLNAVGFYRRLGFVEAKERKAIPDFVVPMELRFAENLA